MSPGVYEAITKSDLGEKRRPVGFDGNAGRLQEGGDLVGGDGNAVIVKDERGVDASQFVVRCHFRSRSVRSGVLNFKKFCKGKYVDS